MTPRRRSPGRPGSDDTGPLASIARFWHRSYAPDYVGFAALLTAYICIAFFAEPFHRMFWTNDLRIMFPHAEVERVPVSMNIVYAAVVPLAVVILTNTIAGASTHKHHVSVLGLAIAIVLTTTLTDLVKNAVGRPRPDLIARCKPAPGTASNTLVTFDVCTEKDHHVLHDGWRSFPSGHSSFSFSGLGYTALFLAGQLRVFVLRHTAAATNSFHYNTSSRVAAAAAAGPAAAGTSTADGAADTSLHAGLERTVHAHGGHDLGRALVCLSPLLGATMIAISRCQDYRHDVYDVCTGALLGWVVAHWSYRRYWPRLASPRCSEPYPSPASAADGGGVHGSGRYGRLRDVEEGGRNVGYELHDLNV